MGPFPVDKKSEASFCTCQELAFPETPVSSPISESLPKVVQSTTRDSSPEGQVQGRPSPLPLVSQGHGLRSLFLQKCC